MTLIDRINKFFRGFIIILNAEERKIANAMYYHSGHKEFYNSTNPYMDMESFKAIDWSDSSISSISVSSITDFMDHSIATYDHYYNSATGLPMIGSMDSSGNPYGSSSSYYQDTYYNHTY